MPVYNLGRGNLGRSPTYSQLDMQVQHGFRLPGHTRVDLSANINNLFDQDTITNINNTPYRDAIPVSATSGFFNGFDGDAVAAANTAIRKDPRFRQGSTFQAPRTMRLMAKFSF